jgi:hypothetical protein
MKIVLLAVILAVPDNATGTMSGRFVSRRRSAPEISEPALDTFRRKL